MMNRYWTFKHWVPPQSDVAEVGDRIPIEQAEKLLLAKLDGSDGNHAGVLLELSFLYSHLRRHDEAIGCFRRVTDLEPDIEKKAVCVLGMGCEAEKQGDYEAAVRFYTEALSMEPAQTHTWYFIHNNLGYSLNRLGRYVDGEKYCRRAIEIEPRLSNAFKNLGLALAGQGRFREAARSYVEATKTNAGDARSMDLLEDLLKKHPELRGGFEQDLRDCEEAVRCFTARPKQPAQTDKEIQIVIACCDQQGGALLLELAQEATQGMANVREIRVSHWKELVQKAGEPEVALVLMAPKRILPDPEEDREVNPWLEAVAALKAIKAKRAVPILVVGNDEEMPPFIDDYCNAGANAVVEAPCPRSLLRRSIARLLNL